MEILNPSNPYGYAFPEIAYEIVEKSKSARHLADLARAFKFKMVLKRCTFVGVRDYPRCIFVSNQHNLVLKQPFCNVLTPVFDYLCPSMRFTLNNKPTYVQPLCYEKDKMYHEDSAADFKKLLPQFDCHPENVFFLKNLPALIDW